MIIAKNILHFFTLNVAIFKFLLDFLNNIAYSYIVTDS